MLKYNIFLSNIVTHEPWRKQRIKASILTICLIANSKQNHLLRTRSMGEILDIRTNYEDRSVDNN
jgi:hypothetical protein